MKNENILCVPLESLKGIFDLTQKYWRCDANTVNSLSHEYIPRSQAEKDFSSKQIIPYALIFDSDGKILYYQRHGSEQRLSGLSSAGIGGHVNDKDEGGTIYGKIISGLKREMKEELGIDVKDEEIQLLGMINEDITEVGLCHVGIVFKIDTDAQLLDYEDEIDNPNWDYPNNLKLQQFELWSTLAIDLLDKSEKEKLIRDCKYE